MATLRDYYGSIAEMMSDRISALSFIQHALTRGLRNEEVLREFLRTYIPRRFNVSTGFIVPRSGFKESVEFSRQIDVLIYDSSRYAPLMQSGEVVICRSDSVVAAIEVKSTLYSSALDDALENIVVVKAIDRRIYGYIFAFKASARDKTIRKRLARMLEFYHPWQLPDVICVLDGQFIERRGETVSKVETKGDQLALFYFRLMRDLATWTEIPEIGEAFKDIGERRYERWF